MTCARAPRGAGRDGAYDLIVVEGAYGRSVCWISSVALLYLDVRFLCVSGDG